VGGSERLLSATIEWSVAVSPWDSARTNTSVTGRLSLPENYAPGTDRVAYKHHVPAMPGDSCCCMNHSGTPTRSALLDCRSTDCEIRNTSSVSCDVSI
jgi:hypothetical protein